VPRRFVRADDFPFDFDRVLGGIVNRCTGGETRGGQDRTAPTPQRAHNVRRGPSTPALGVNADKTYSINRADRPLAHSRARPPESHAARLAAPRHLVPSPHARRCRAGWNDPRTAPSPFLHAHDFGLACWSVPRKGYAVGGRAYATRCMENRGQSGHLPVDLARRAVS